MSIKYFPQHINFLYFIIIFLLLAENSYGIFSKKGAFVGGLALSSGLTGGQIISKDNEIPASSMENYEQLPGSHTWIRKVCPSVCYDLGIVLK